MQIGAFIENLRSDFCNRFGNGDLGDSSAIVECAPTNGSNFGTLKILWDNNMRIYAGADTHHSVRAVFVLGIFQAN